MPLLLFSLKTLLNPLRLIPTLLFLLLLLSFQNTCSQSYPITASLQIIPPYSVYLPDYCLPGSDKIRVILLQNDLTVPVYDVRLQMTIEWNGSVIMRTSPNFRPRPITLNAGVPNLISGDDLCIYFNTDAIDFSGYSRENYERTKALPEGAYKISFTAYDYRRQNVQVSNIGSNIFFLQKKSPPLLNSPICNSRIQKTDPQFIVFNWSSVNTPSLPDNETEYTFSLYEIKPKNSNPNYIVKSSRPVFTTVTESNTFQYTPGEPALLDSMEYVWTVQARSKDGRDLYANQGYSIPCKFTYGGIDPFTVKYIRKPIVFAEPIHEKAAKIWWAPARETENVELYRIEYRGTTNSMGEFPWHTEEKETDTTLNVYPLKPDREYDVRMRYKVSGVYGPYSEIIKFKTPPHKVVECGQPSNPPPLSTNTTPLPLASVGMIVRIGLFNVILTQVSGENGTFSGKGKIITLGFGFGMAMQFKDIFINTDKVVTRGDMYSEGDSMDKYVDEKIDRQHKVEAFKKFAGKIPDENTPLPELQEFAKALTEIHQDRIDNAIALNREEKQQINDARSKATTALKTLNNPQATDNEKKEAEKNLRQAVADARPALNKLANTLDRGIITVVSQWFKNIRDFLNRYKGNNDDEKRQAEMWHHRMDSTVEVLSKKTSVPDSLMNAMLVAHQNAKTAWLNLEKGSDGKKRKGPSNNFDDGFTAEDIALCKKEVAAAEKVNEFIGKVLANGTVIKKCYYEIEGNKFHNGDTILIPKSNNKYEVKGYKAAAKPVDSKSVWTGFGAKKDSARYVYTPSTVSQDITGSLLSTIFTRDSIYRITKKDKTIDSLVKMQDTLRCRVVVVDINLKKSTNQTFGYDENSFTKYTYHETFENKSIPWKSLQSGNSDLVDATVTPSGVSKHKLIDFYKNQNDITTISHDSKINFKSSTSADNDSHFIYLKTKQFKDSIQKIGLFTFEKIRRKTVLIIYVDEENDDTQIVQPTIKTASDTTIVVAPGKNKFLDTHAAPLDSVVTKIVGNNTLQYIVAGKDKICNSKAKSTNERVGDIPCSTEVLKDSLNKIYDPAGINFESVNVMQDRLLANYDIDRNDTLCANAVTQIEYKTMLDTVWKSVTQQGDIDTYYFIMVKNATYWNEQTKTNNSLCGIGFGLLFPNPTAEENKYVKTCLIAINANKKVRTFTNTCAHELGHSSFGLLHPFQPTSDPNVIRSYYKGNDPDNFMDYSDGHKSRKYQWILIRDKDKYPK